MILVHIPLVEDVLLCHTRLHDLGHTYGDQKIRNELTSNATSCCIVASYERAPNTDSLSASTWSSNLWLNFTCASDTFALGLYLGKKKLAKAQASHRGPRKSNRRNSSLGHFKSTAVSESIDSAYTETFRAFTPASRHNGGSGRGPSWYRE